MHYFLIAAQDIERKTFVLSQPQYSLHPNLLIVFRVISYFISNKCAYEMGHLKPFIFHLGQNGAPKTINFPFGTNGKLMILGVPFCKHIRKVFEINS